MFGMHLSNSSYAKVRLLLVTRIHFVLMLSLSANYRLLIQHDSGYYGERFPHGV